MGRDRLALFAGLLALGCQQGAPPQGDSSRPSIPEPIIPSALAHVRAASSVSWVEQLPKTKPQAAAGDRVWATVARPGAEVYDLGVYTVDGVYDGVYSLTDKMGQRIDGVSPALVHRAAKPGKLKEGDVVLFHTSTTPGFIGRVSKLVPGAEIRARYDWAGTTRETAVDHAEPAVTGLRPLAHVAFPKFGTSSRGLLIALGDDKGWVRTDSGHVQLCDRAKLSELPVPRDRLEVGHRVRAYRWATGFQDGVISEVLEPGLRYKVKLAGNKPEQAYFFSSVFRSR